MSAILEVERVSKAFGGLVANKAVTLRVPEGAICGLIGPNGSGKTTLFNSIVGQHPIDAGSIRFQGREISRLRVAQIARLGLLRTFQQTRIYGGMTCMQNMVISVPTSELGWRSMFRKSPPSDLRKADDLLHFVGLHAKRHLRARDLSFGQQKLLEFAMALMSGPRMLLLDEPTAGINPTLINGLLDQLRQVNAQLGITLLVIEHNMRVIMNLAQYIYCLAHGELLAEGKPEQVQKDPRVLDAYLGAR
ncbi:MAG: ABC transporter ATP-binding protein [Deltaproteobacteria bacterium]|nr:MAG: ABC transporter ATP-binding protein [Deltaproteobacteria bacterium]TMB41034.1 MAG: ABC transporter ATP-binding protein [Deltaproteobacteria bacterium]